MTEFSTASEEAFFFGLYQKPELLKDLEAYQKADISWEYLGFHIDFDAHYPITPLDVIPFAGTGGDGIHFGFLTDFGFVEKLDDAPIVCVSPSNEPPVKLVARNLRDFLAIVMVIGYAEFLDTDYDSEGEVAGRLEEWESFAIKDTLRKDFSQEVRDAIKDRLEKTIKGRSDLRKILTQSLGIAPMTSIVAYMKSLRANRQYEIALNDAFDIGIQQSTAYPIAEAFDYSNSNASAINSYLQSANKSERLLFYRNLSYHEYVLLGADEVDKVKSCISTYLIQDGFSREASIMERQFEL